MLDGSWYSLEQKGCLIIITSAAAGYATKIRQEYNCWPVQRTEIIIIIIMIVIIMRPWLRNYYLKICE
jgi:hypothetical protein